MWYVRIFLGKITALRSRDAVVRVCVYACSSGDQEYGGCGLGGQQARRRSPRRPRQILQRYCKIVARREEFCDRAEKSRCAGYAYRVAETVWRWGFGRESGNREAERNTPNG